MIDTEPVGSIEDATPATASMRHMATTAGVAMAALALCGWTIWRSVVNGRELQRTAPEIFLGAAPLVGRNFRDGWDWRFSPALVAAAVAACAVVWLAYRPWWASARLTAIAWVSGVAGALFAALLALTDGRDGLLYPVTHETEYLAVIADLPPIPTFIDTFTEQINDYTVHVRGHPPAYTALLAVFDRIGLRGAWPIVVLSLVSIAVGVAAVIATTARIAGPDLARRAAPFLALTPSALWLAISADAVFFALGAIGVWLLTLSFEPTHGLGTAAASGVVLGSLPYFTYLGATFMVVPVAVIIVGVRRVGRDATAAIATALAAAGLVTLTWVLAGFWWFDGVATTKREYWEGSARFRVWDYFGYANLAAACFALGPAVIVGLTRLRRHGWWLVGGGLLALTISHLSQFTKAEVERIWLLFFPFITIAAGVAGMSRRARSIWLVIQAAAAIVLQAALVSKW
jgi:methylthioxylose transferase